MFQSNCLPGVLEGHVRGRAGAPFLFVKGSGGYESISFGEVWDRVLRFASFLKGRGITKGSHVAILSANCPEWVIADLAVMALGGVVIPVYPTLSTEEVKYLLEDSESVAVVVQEKAHLDQVVGAGSSLVKTVVVMDQDAHLVDDSMFYFQSVLAKSEPEEVDLSKISREDLASIVYTSGTSGPPKGVMLSHGNFLTNVEDIRAAVALSAEDRVLSFLPLSHVFERTVGYYTILAVGAQIYYAREMTSVAEDMLDAHPTVVVSVPRLYEKIQSKIVSQLSGFKKLLFHWATLLGNECGRLGVHKPGLMDRVLLGVFEKLVYSKIRAKTGGKLRFFVSGGAPLGEELGDFFRGLGLLILEGYGQTESSPVIACNRLEKYKMGSVGKALDHVECDVTAEGELRARGPSIMMGYWKKPDKTKETVDEDGWLYTGDIVEIDDEGYIFIVDRKKDLIVLSNGKNVAPQRLEKAISMDPHVSQVIVIGDKRNFISALVVPDMEKLSAFAERNEVSLEDPKVVAFMENAINEAQKSFSRYEQVKVFRLLPDEFTQEAGELTPTLKPKRNVIGEKYADIIESMYQKG